MMDVKAKLILEIMGRPAATLKETLQTLVMRLKAEQGVTLISHTIHEPRALEQPKDLYTTFAEVELSFASLQHFLAVIMGYMPAHAEVFEPEHFKLSANQVNEFSNYLLARLHRYDEISKVALLERNALLKQLDFLKSGGTIEELERINKQHAAAREGAATASKDETQKPPAKKPRKAKKRYSKGRR